MDYYKSKGLAPSSKVWFHGEGKGPKPSKGKLVCLKMDPFAKFMKAIRTCQNIFSLHGAINCKTGSAYELRPPEIGGLV